MIYTIEPIAARLLKSGDTFRDGRYTHRVVEVDHNEITYYLRPTQKDLERKLRNAQHTRDQNKELYERALTDPDPIPRYMRWSVDD